MKLKIFLFIVSIFSFTYFPQAPCDNKEQCNKKEIVVGVWPFGSIYTYYPPKNEFQNRWGTLKTIAAGALLGGLFGPLNYLTDKPFWPFNWYIFTVLRDRIVSDIINNAEAQSESIEPGLFFNSAWLSDWIAYVATYEIMHKYNMG